MNYNESGGIMVQGRIHSIESCGSVDGPGLRCVVFFQGCSLRCRYCHNPDTWSLQSGQEVDSDQLIKKILRFKPYFGEQGGVTLSGGEPLLQPDFAVEILRQCKQHGIHTAIDTSGWVEAGDLEKVLPFTDLVLLDIKAVEKELYKWLTGQSNDKFLVALDIIKRQKTPLWVRYVLLPGVNDTEELLNSLKDLTSSLGIQVQKVEFLPYHRLGLHKWESLGLKYSLSNLIPPPESIITQLNKNFNYNLNK